MDELIKISVGVGIGILGIITFVAAASAILFVLHTISRCVGHGIKKGWDSAAKEGKTP